MLLFLFADGRYYSNREERVNKPCQFFYNIPSYATFPLVSRCENADACDDAEFRRVPAGYTKTVIAYNDGVVIRDLGTIERRADNALKLHSVSIYLIIILIVVSVKFYF